MSHNTNINHCLNWKLKIWKTLKVCANIAIKFTGGHFRRKIVFSLHYLYCLLISFVNICNLARCSNCPNLSRQILIATPNSHNPFSMHQKTRKSSKIMLPNAPKHRKLPFFFRKIWKFKKKIFPLQNNFQTKYSLFKTLLPIVVTLL